MLGRHANYLSQVNSQLSKIQAREHQDFFLLRRLKQDVLVFPDSTIEIAALL